MQPFHLAIPVHNLAIAEKFYVTYFNCSIGRRSNRWIDFDFFGHQLTLHLDQSIRQNLDNNQVDGKSVPTHHFGVILEWEQWHILAERLKARSCAFIIEPYIRFAGQAGEQATMFFKDPSGNALEFKSFKQLSQLFATE